MEYLQKTKGEWKVDLQLIDKWIKEADLETAARHASQKIEHPDWQTVAGILSVAALKKKVPKYREGLKEMRKEGIMSKQVADFILKNYQKIEENIKEERDYTYNYFAIQTLKKGYLLHNEGKYYETPQYFFMRVSAEIYCGNINKTIECYNALSQNKIIQATPTLANAGTPNPQMSSCFLGSPGDSLYAILEFYKLCGLISKNKGGLGIGISHIRHSKIGKYGKSKGIVAMLRCFNELVKYVDQTGTRKGAGTIFLPTWHVDVLRFLDLKKNFGPEEFRARDLNYCIWIQDLFMKRVIEGGKWSLFCPKLAKGLNDCYGSDFEKLYLKYEQDPNIPKDQYDAGEIYSAIIRAQQQTSQPFIMFDDACNLKNNQNYLGHITNSNLCLEIIQYNSPITEIEQPLENIEKYSDEDLEKYLNSLSDDDFEKVVTHHTSSCEHKLKGLIASCNLGSVVIDQFVKFDTDGKPYYDYKELTYYTKLLVRNITNIIKRNYYPIPFIKQGNDDYMPIGIGIVGTANAIAKMDLIYESKEAIKLIETISACMYHSCLQESRDMAKETGRKYKDFEKSPLGKGYFQFDLWNLEREKFLSYNLPSSLYDNVPRFKSSYTPVPVDHFHASESWSDLMSSISQYGIYHTVLLCGQPNANTAQIIRRNECHEPFHSNLYLREVLSGAFPVYNEQLVHDFEKLNLWSSNVVDYLMAHSGSIQGISKENFCENLSTTDFDRLLFLEQKYKIGFEISQKHMINLISLRGHYVCQSQSMNIRMSDPTFDKLWQLHMYSWLSGQKTGMYYLHQRPIIDRQKITLTSSPSSSPSSSLYSFISSYVSSLSTYYDTFSSTISSYMNSLYPSITSKNVDTPITSKNVNTLSTIKKNNEKTIDELIGEGKLCLINDPTCKSCQ